jgi:peptide/nickel transport system ATP-binding protein/oligopeptide transport system ATP-binding protein
MSAVPVPDPDKEHGRERILLTGDLPSPINPPPAACSTPGAGRRRTSARPSCRRSPMSRPGHVSACHFPEVKQVV